MYTESSFSVTYLGYITSINYLVESIRLLDVMKIQVFSTVADDDMEEDLLLSIKLSVDILMGQTNGKQSFISSRRTYFSGMDPENHGVFGRGHQAHQMELLRH